MNKKTYYMLDCSALMCYFQIKINDVEVFALNVDGQTATDIPINQGILESGNQEIEVRCFPLTGTYSLHKEAYVRYKIVAFDVSSGDFQFLEQFENNQTPPVTEGLPFTSHKSSFKAEVPYKLDAWQNGLDLKKVDFEIKPKLYDAYMRISVDIQNGNYAKFAESFKKREQNMASAMYLSFNEANERIEKLIYDFSHGFEVAPIPEDAVVELSAYGKLACLKRLNGMSALFLENKETEEELILQPTFFIPEGKTEFEVI